MPTRHTSLHERLVLPCLQAPASEQAPLRLAELERLFIAAQEEIGLLTSERDELVDAIRRWAKADRFERHELLLETLTQELRTELRSLRTEIKRLKRENAALRMEDRTGQQALRA